MSAAHDAVQRSLYRNLIIESYYNEARPYLPTDDSKLWELADAENLEQWQNNKKAVLLKFTEVSKQDGTKVFQNRKGSRRVGSLGRTPGAKEAGRSRQRQRSQGTG